MKISLDIKNMNNLKKYTIIFLIVINSLFSKAQVKLDSSFKTLETITVIGRNLKISDSNSIQLITKLNKKELSSSVFRTTPEALMGSSGVFVQKTNHGGGSAFIRGLTGNQTLMVIDGIRLNNATYRYGPNQYLNTIDLYSIDKIEIAKGTGSVAYGSDAMGGTILLESKENNFSNTSKWSASTMVKYITSDMEKTNRSEIEFSNKNIAMNGGLTFRNFGDLMGGNGIGIQFPSGYKESAHDLKLKIKTNDKSILTIASQFLRQKYIPIYHKILLENYKINQTDQQLHGLHYLKYAIENNNKWFNKIIATASLQQSIEQRSNQKNNSPTLRKEADTIKGKAFSMEIISNPTAFWKMNTGFDYYKDKIYSIANDINPLFNSINPKRGLYPNGATYKSSSLFSLHQFLISKFKMEAGLRYNFIQININDNTLGEVNVKPTALVYNTGILYTLNKNNQIYGSIASGYRAPNIDDMGTLGIVDFRYEVPTYNLKPEKSLNTEIGYKYMSKNIQFNFSAYQMSLKDIIARVKLDGQVINGYTVYNKVNIESSYINGTEVNLHYRISSAIWLSSNVNYTYGQNLTKNEPMRRIPPMFGQNKIEWNSNKIQLSLTHQYAGKQDRLAQGDKDDNRIGKLGTPQWNVFHIEGVYNNGPLTCNIALINLLNEKYKTHGSGIYGMGRAISTSLQWRF